MKKTNINMAVLLCIGASSLFAGETRDPRVRTFVMPTRVVWTSANNEKSSVGNSEILLTEKYGQVPEGVFLAGSGCRMENKGEPASVLVDFGRELHGGVHLASGGTSGKNVKVRVRFGESVAEAMAAIGAPDASVSNLGTLAPGSFTVGGVRASTVLARAAARPLTAAMRRDCVPAIAGWMIGHGEHLTVSICAAHPDHLGVGSDTDELVLAEFDRWGLNAHRWGEWSPQIGDTDSHVGEQPSDER